MKAAPFWEESHPESWSAFGAERVPPTRTSSLSASVNTLIIGAGYTGLSAAIELSKSGQEAVLVDQGSLWNAIGPGCSSRNGGQVGFSIKPSCRQLSQYYGEETAHAIMHEALVANAYLEKNWSGEDIAWRKNGTFVGAHTLGHLRRLSGDAVRFSEQFAQPVKLISPEEVSSEIASPLYVGGVVYENEASLHPRRLHLKMLNAAAANGAVIFEHHRVIALQRQSRGFLIDVMAPTGLNKVTAERVLIATNGTTTDALGPAHRWLFPVGSYQLATEDLGSERAHALIKRQRNVSDVRRVVTYTRLSPDGRRVIFGGRSSALETNARSALPRLRRQMLEVFPSLERTAVDHVWLGHVGFTFREHPLVGEDRGYFYSLGYCGQGIPLAIYYGHRLGQVLARTAEPPRLWNLGVQTRFYYRKKAWFLPAAILAYQWADRLGV